MKTAGALLALSLAAAPAALAVPINGTQTVTVTPAGNCPATVAAEALLKLHLKTADDRSLAATFRWSDGTSAAATGPDLVLVTRSTSSAIFRARQSRTLSAPGPGWFTVHVRSARENGETPRKTFAISCALAVKLPPGALPGPTLVPRLTPAPR